ncbi:MAG: flagellar basal-body MS-ring/collar protein FliF [Pseudomonadota bacterium]
MNMREMLNQVLSTLIALDTQKKIALGAAFTVTLAAVIFISFQASKPATSPLYSNLSRDDLNAMSRILSENGIQFNVITERGAIEVSTAMTGQARMLLAERGLPSTEKSGYELFDQVNTLGLTSFMQGVTNKRAIEGELVRTIQMINGVNSARVHIVLEDRNVFRRNANNQSSASVVLKTYGKLPGRSINAIRHMVSAAVPGLVASNVTIVGSDGTLLTTNDDASGGSSKLVDLERDYERDVEEKIVLALGAHIGLDNLRVSASVKLNSDKRSIEEVIYDPESRTERSVQVVKEAGTTENKESSKPVTVDQNLPDEGIATASGQSSSENSERREEMTNYEINEKKISMISDGYLVENLSVAVLINKSRLDEILGANADEAQIESKIEELEQIVSAAISTSDDRGDRVTVKPVEFMPVSSIADAGSDNAALGFLAMHFGSILNSLGVIIGAILFAVLGIKPVLAFLKQPPATPQPQAQIAGQSPDKALPPSATSTAPVLADQVGDVDNISSGQSDGSYSVGNEPEMGLDVDLTQVTEQESRIKTQLEKMVGQSEERTAIAIRHWLQQDNARAT